MIAEQRKVLNMLYDHKINVEEAEGLISALDLEQSIREESLLNCREFRDRFTERARSAIHHAVLEAIRFNRSLVDPEHLLLGIIREWQGIAARVFLELGVNLENMEAELRNRIAPGGAVAKSWTFSKSAWLIFAYAMQESEKLGIDHVGTEHFLLALLREENGLASKILSDFGVTMEKARKVLNYVPKRNDNS